VQQIHSACWHLGRGLAEAVNRSAEVLSFVCRVMPSFELLGLSQAQCNNFSTSASCFVDRAVVWRIAHFSDGMRACKNIVSATQVHPPLHFFNGGIKAMIAVLREHVPLTRSSTDSNTYVVAAGESALQLAPPLATQASVDSDALGPPGGGSSTESPPVPGEVVSGGAALSAAYALVLLRS
jgi:hypothetical protein